MVFSRSVPSRSVALLLVTSMAALASCQSSAQCETDPPGQSVARVWNEAALHAISRDFPAPTVHSRNLFHLSAAMYDVWAAYDDDASGYFVDAVGPGDATDRDTAVSYAAYALLRTRYARADGAPDSLAEFDELMTALCLDPDDPRRNDATTAAGFGHDVALTIIAATAEDGSRERQAYQSSDYQPVNEPLVVDKSGTVMIDPNRWQPLLLEEAVTQNGIPLDTGLQSFVGAHWGFVEPFALTADLADGVPIDPGAPPAFGSPAFVDAVVDVIRLNSFLQPDGKRMIDISPASLGGNTLGRNDGNGHDVNPATDAPYATQLVDEGDYGRVVAEYWADGPTSETPPGHWNTIANEVSDSLDSYRIGGSDVEVDRLEWDVKLYFLLNGANHDAAIAAWGAKAHFDYVRPISMIRYMGGLGQSSDQALASYHPDGLPLVDGLIELVSDESVANRHEGLAPGTIAVLAWNGPPESDDEVAGVAWRSAEDWVTYQQSTFVTPSFAAYVSGHSAFSRASAEVLAAFTGSDFFPGGLGEHEVPAGTLDFEKGPSGPVTLQWATYFDAADQAGQSRLYGGIHVEADDLAGRLLGAECGRAAWEKAQALFGS